MRSTARPVAGKTSFPRNALEASEREASRPFHFFPALVTLGDALLCIRHLLSYFAFAERLVLPSSSAYFGEELRSFLPPRDFPTFWNTASSGWVLFLPARVTLVVMALW